MFMYSDGESIHILVIPEREWSRGSTSPAKATSKVPYFTQRVN